MMASGSAASSAPVGSPVATLARASLMALTMELGSGWKYCKKVFSIFVSGELVASLKVRTLKTSKKAAERRDHATQVIEHFCGPY